MTTLLRLARLEGLSFLFLMFVAMPLKYGWQLPIFVRVGGMVHGLLFCAYVAAALWAKQKQRWSTEFLAWALISSSVPLGFVFFERSLQAEPLLAEPQTKDRSPLL